MGIISVSLPSDGTTADVADYNTPITTIVNEINGGLDNDNIKSDAAIAGSKLANNSIDLGDKADNWDGWIGITDSWVYASATTVTVPTDATTKFSVGDRIKFDQTSTKYFYVTAVSATTLTLNGGTDYTVANAAITWIYYSKASTPLGFPNGFNYTITWTGVTATFTSVNRFWINGRECTLDVHRSTNQTSNATTMTATLPVTARTVANMAWHGITSRAVDNSGSITTPGLVEVSSAGTTASLYKDMNGGAWTGSGSKGADFRVTYEI